MMLVLFEHPRDSAVAPLTFKTSVQNDILPVLVGENKPSVIPVPSSCGKRLAQMI